MSKIVQTRTFSYRNPVSIWYKGVYKFDDCNKKRLILLRFL